ncbi:hypothetical protein MRX96_057387 [Rhipicephalus microplus]
MAAPRYHVFVGAETGLLKGVNTEKRTFANLNSLQEVSKSNEISCLRWKDDSESEIYAGIRSQTVKTFCPNSGICKDVFEVKGGEGPIKGLGVVNSSRNLVTCVSSGLLRVWAKDGCTEAETEVGADVFRMRQHPRKEGIVATGGKENELKLWDLENLQKPVFVAKNVRNDFLDLRVPVWVTDMDFLKDSEKIIAITGHHQLYLKSRLNCLLMRTDFTIEDEEENKDREEATVDDELWEEMEEVDEATDVSAKKASTKRSCRATMAKSKKRRKSIKQDG